MSPEPASPSTRAESFALAQGIRDTRSALRRWRAAPGSVLGPWLGGAAAIACALLLAVWIVSLLVRGDATRFYLPGVDGSGNLADVPPILGRNLLVLALHATACVAGFIAGSSIGQVAETKTGLSRLIHERAGSVAIGWVVLVTAFSLLTQALALGFTGASLAQRYGISSGVLVLTVLPHALIELTAVFLPLAAWLIASRRQRWSELLAATLLTVAIALPMLVLAAAIELTVWPQLLRLASPALL